MPPSHHSGGSHHSSSHSSSHHSSSSHSSRSHSSSSHYSSSSSYGRSYSSSSHYSSPARRTRTNQPIGSTIAPIVHTCRHHTYHYYSKPWTDSNSGKYYKDGYYDENGKYYAGLITKNGNNNISTFNCEYCGNKAKYEWKNGEVPECSCCGARMTQVNNFATDETSSSSSYTTNNSYSRNNSSSGIKKFATIFVILLVLSGITNSCSGILRSNDNDYSNNYSSYDVPSNTELFGRKIYLETIDNNSYYLTEKDYSYSKELKWDNEYDSYYDPETNCYIWYNNEVEPAIWQYWYDDIAGSNEYGWMEYGEDGWWIETENGWEPYTGDTSNLWYITD